MEKCEVDFDSYFHYVKNIDFFFSNINLFGSLFCFCLLLCFVLFS